MKYCALLLGLGLLSMMLLVSCQPKVEAERAIVVASTIVPTRTAVTQATVVPTQTQLPPTATVEVTDVPTATATSLPTLTPLPTFAPDELETAVADLLANPMNCDVPCWWGAIPGETTAFEVQQFLTHYQIEEYYSRDNDQNQIPEYIELNSDMERFGLRVSYGFDNTILTGIYINITGSPPTITELLIKYGQPDEIMLNTQIDPRQDYPWLSFTVVYLSEGVGISYLIDGKYQNDMVIGCIGDKDTGRSPHFRLVAPNKATSYKDFFPIFRDGRYMPLQEATGLTIDDFMQPFHDPSLVKCFETPLELWN